MTCTKPFILRKGQFDVGMPVPCRHCMACRIAITREWTTRLMHEAQYHKENCFITLTYATEHLPADRSLSKRTLQLFIKRLRKSLGDTLIKYYACGEYGKLHSREHYHLIIFGWSPPLEDLYYAEKKKGKQYYGSRRISTIWTNGFNTVGSLTRDSCQYTVGYVRKKLYGQQAKSVYEGRLPPFALQSRGLGARYAIENRTRIKADLCVRENNKNVGLPRYYAKVVNVDGEKLKMKRYQKEAQVVAHYVDDGYDYHDYIKLALAATEQKEKNLIAQEKLRRNR